jgi:hypothetical protein
MQYAVLTRDYVNDYRWSWAARGKDFPLAEISQSLKSQIPDGEKGVVVSCNDGNFHILLASLNKLGEKTNGKDSENRDIDVYLIFSEISQEEVKGLVRYYYQNWENPGNAFADIVHWKDDNKSWELAEDKIIETFNNIPKGKISGRKLVQEIQENHNEIQKTSREPMDWLDYDLSETDGVKILMKSGSVKIAVDEMPVVEKVVTIHKDPNWLMPLIGLCALLCVALSVAVYFVNDYSQKNGTLEVKDGEQKLKLKEVDDALKKRPTQDEFNLIKKELEELKKSPTKEELIAKKGELEKDLKNAEEENEKLQEYEYEEYKGAKSGDGDTLYIKKKKQNGAKN